MKINVIGENIPEEEINAYIDYGKRSTSTVLLRK